MSHFMISWLIQNRCNRISESWKPGDETGGNIAELLSWKDVFRHLVLGVDHRNSRTLLPRKFELR